MADGIIGSIFGLVDELTSLRNSLDNNDITTRKYLSNLKNRTTNINKEASKSILAFPVFCSDSCDYDLAARLASAMEFRNAVLVKLIIERIGLIRFDKNETKETLINRVKGFEDVRGFKEDSVIYENMTNLPSLYSVFKNPKFDMGIFCEEMDLNLNMVDGKRLVLNEGDGPSKAEFTRALNVMDQLKQSEVRGSKVTRPSATDVYKAELTLQFEKDIAASIKKENDDKESKEKIIDDFNNQPNVGGTVVKIDPKKYNKLEPLKMEVEVEYASENQTRTTKMTLGVKSVVHTIPSEEVTKFLPKAKFDMSFLIKLAKLYTGEISFWKEFVLNLGEIKGGFDKHKAGENKWFFKLKRLTDTNNYKKIFNRKTVMPTVTLAISMEDVEEMLRETNGRFDLTNPSTVYDLINTLSLLNFVILDEARERVWIYEEDEKDFNILTPEDLRQEKEEISQRDLMKVLLTATNR